MPSEARKEHEVLPSGSLHFWPFGQAAASSSAKSSWMSHTVEVELKRQIWGSPRGHHAAEKGLPDHRIRRGHDYRAAVRDLTHVVRRHLSGHHRSKPERCPYTEGRHGPLFGFGSVLALLGLQ